MKSYQKLLEANKAWAADMNERNPEFFKKMAEGQSPEFLWIGCSDSRAPADRITGTEPGQLFVHRNVANLVIYNDINLLSVLQYAVDVLKVKHIMVVGHYGCGGVRAAMGNEDLGLINQWIRNIKDVYNDNKAELEQIEGFNERADRLAELNVVEQVRNLLKTTTVQHAWARGNSPHLHGWMLDLKSGLIKQLIEIEANQLDNIAPIYRYENLKVAEVVQNA